MAATNSHLLNLPAEITNQIYELVLSDIMTKLPEPSKWSFDKPDYATYVNLLLVNKQIKTEAESIFKHDYSGKVTLYAESLFKLYGMLKISQRSSPAGGARYVLQLRVANYSGAPHAFWDATWQRSSFIALQFDPNRASHDIQRVYSSSRPSCSTGCKLFKQMQDATPRQWDPTAALPPTVSKFSHILQKTADVEMMHKTYLWSKRGKEAERAMFVFSGKLADLTLDSPQNIYTMRERLRGRRKFEQRLRLEEVERAREWVAMERYPSLI